MASGSSQRSRVGVGAVAELFYAGRYHDVLARTVDARGGPRPGDVAFAVGALAFVGRVVEAESLFDRARARAAPRSLAAGAFFLCVARCRAGRFGDARRGLRDAVRATAGARDAWSRALLLQGAACVRFFTGWLGRAAAVAARALASARRAGFAYAQMLANDLRGHALAQGGHVEEAVAVLGHARDQAARLGYANNAHVIETAAALYRARVAPPARAAAILGEMAARESAQDTYSRRALRLDLAVALAWLGRATEAEALVAEVAPLCAGERRQQCLLAVVRAQVARVRGGWSAARAHVDDAARWLGDEDDPARRAEVSGLRLALARADGDDRARREAEAALRAVASEGGLVRARSWLAAYADEAPPRDDAATALLAAVARASVAAAMREGALGLVPEAAGLAPGRRLHLFDDALVVEDRGDVARLPALSARSTEVLLALAAGPRGRADLVRDVWRVRSYAPARHDTLVKTAVSRLRASAGAAGAWVVSGEGGYALAAGVEVVRHASAAAARVGAAVAPPRADPRVGRNDRQRRIVAHLEREGRATVGELAARLREPVRTVSRELAAMCGDAVLAREGAGRATAYRLREATTGGAG